MTLPLILASASPRRHELLALTGLTFEVAASQIDERPHSGELPPEHVCRLSKAKAQASGSQIKPPALILAADTIVVDGELILGKPHDEQDAWAILRRLRGRTHHVYTAITLLNSATEHSQTQLVCSPVTMRAYSDEEITAYIAGGDPFDKAGAYAIQHPDFRPVENAAHCFANVMGLPLCHLTHFDLELIGNELAAACQKHLHYECPIYQDILSEK